MRKSARLDKILIGLGFTDEEGIKSGLARQVRHGGRLGMNLVELGKITEDQLLTALGEQFGVPKVSLDPGSLDAELIERMPADLLRSGQLLPVSWNEDRRVLSVAVADPGDRDLLARVKLEYGARAVRVALASERALQRLCERITGASKGPTRPTRSIALPELFAVGEDDESVARGVDVAGAASDAGSFEPVVMVTRSASRKNFLPGLFRREGWELTVTSEPDELAEAVCRARVRTLLVSEEMREDFERWRKEGRVTTGDADVTVFQSLAGSLAGNPLPYASTVRSLRSAVQAIADFRCARFEASPPFGLIALEAEALAERRGLGRVATDGLNLALHLLLPAEPVDLGTGAPGTVEPFSDFSSSLELARRLDFPFPVDRLLAACHGLYTARVAPGEGDREWGPELSLAAQILAIVWYRHNHVPRPEGGDEEAMIAVRTSLRERGGTLTTRDLIEAYLQLIRDRGGVAAEAGDRKVVLVGSDRIERVLSPALERVGRETVVADDLPDAQRVVERRTPAAVVVDHADFPGDVDKFCRVTKLDGSCLLFVLTDAGDPALVLNLLDLGVDDVFGPPHDFDLVAARINRAIRSRARPSPAERREAGQFSATFEVFSFLDLIQMLGQAMKSVRIELSRDEEGDETATIDMRKGRIIHAVSGDLVGEEAVYRVIAWEDEGEFTVREQSTFEELTIQASTESILMEGCKRLDEAQREQVS